MGKYHNQLDINQGNTCYVKLLNQIKEGSIILEFGPADGVMTEYLARELNCKVYIVEIDEDSYSKAIQFSVGGVLDDIENYQWENEFIGIRFDYAIFSDVLEHLRNPAETLLRTKKLLKDSGLVLASIPNIAHNDILLKLIENKFDYTDTGLLDFTHVHFFAYNNLFQLFLSAGFRIIREDWVECKTFHSEQAIKSDTVGRYLKDAFYHRPCGEIYQFIITAQIEEADQNDLKPENLRISELLKASDAVAVPDYRLQVQEQEEIIEQKENYINEQREWLSKRDTMISERNAIIEQKENYINEQREWLSERDAMINERDIRIDELSGALESIITSYRPVFSKEESVDIHNIVQWIASFSRHGIIQRMFYVYRRLSRLKNRDK